MSIPPGSDEHNVIEEILNASDHYKVLSVPESVDSAQLRRAYLTKSVKVHPDKCSDPRATEAFQRVAEAWTVLSNEETRAEYDARGKQDAADNNSKPYTPPPPPSFQDALFAFAAATSMMRGGGSAAGSMAQTMFWAEKLVNQRPEATKTEKTANVAMALGAGLRAVAVGARFMGLKNASVVADRTASLAQTAGVGAMVADAAKDNPAVKQILEKGGERAKEISGSINRSMKEARASRLGGTPR